MKKFDFSRLFGWLSMFYSIVVTICVFSSWMPVWATIAMSGTGIVLLMLDIYIYLKKKNNETIFT